MRRGIRGSPAQEEMLPGIGGWILLFTDRVYCPGDWRGDFNHHGALLGYPALANALTLLPSYEGTRFLCG